MTDTIFRTKAESQPESLPEGKITSEAMSTTEEVPYLDYEREHGHPYSVDYFKLGDSWQDPEGGFAEEVSIIEDYIQKKVESGEFPNDRKSIEEKLKGMEKFNNIKGEPRPLVRIETLAAYIRFLGETDKIKFNLRRYGNT